MKRYIIIVLISIYTIGLSAGIMMDGARSDQRIAEFEQQHKADAKTIADLTAERDQLRETSNKWHDAYDELIKAIGKSWVQP